MSPEKSPSGVVSLIRRKLRVITVRTPRDTSERRTVQILIRKK